MKKFTIKLLENINTTQYYEVNANIQFIIKAENEGEAAYIADSTLSSMDNQSNFNVLDISLTDKNPIVESVDSTLSNLPKDTSAKDKINKAWDVEFDGKNPTYLQKMEFFYQLRKNGFDGETIFATLGKKI